MGEGFLLRMLVCSFLEETEYKIAYLNQEVRSLYVKIHGLLKVCFRCLLERMIYRDARIRNQDIDLASPSHCFSDETFDVLNISSVRLDGDGIVGTDLLDELVRWFRVGRIVDDNSGAEGRKLEGGRSSDALRGTCDESDLAGKGLCGGHGGMLWLNLFVLSRKYVLNGLRSCGGCSDGMID